MNSFMNMASSMLGNINQQRPSPPITRKIETQIEEEEDIDDLD